MSLSLKKIVKILTNLSTSSIAELKWSGNIDDEPIKIDRDAVQLICGSIFTLNVPYTQDGTPHKLQLEYSPMGQPETNSIDETAMQDSDTDFSVVIGSMVSFKFEFVYTDSDGVEHDGLVRAKISILEPLVKLIFKGTKVELPVP